MKRGSAAGLTHPNIVTVHDLIEEGGKLWIVMEYLDGLSLHQLLSQVGTLPAQSVAAIGQHLLAALRTAHQAGVLHRDVKPANVMLTGDRVVLTDFGIATVEGDIRMTTSRRLRGTPAFMAPERLHGGPASKEADMWSFGATLYSAIEGQPPYPGQDAATVLGMARSGGYPPPRRAGSCGRSSRVCCTTTRCAASRPSRPPDYWRACAPAATPRRSDRPFPCGHRYSSSPRLARASASAASMAAASSGVGAVPPRWAGSHHAPGGDLRVVALGPVQQLRHPRVQVGA